MTSDRAREQLREERETFEQARRHGALWFALRLSMGYVGILLMTLVAVASTYLILNPEHYGAPVVGVAVSTLLVDIVTMAASIFRLGCSKAVLSNSNPSRCAKMSRSVGQKTSKGDAHE